VGADGREGLKIGDANRGAYLEMQCTYSRNVLR